MKELKALFKHELRNIWGIILYFIGCFVIGTYILSNIFQDRYINYLRSGYSYTSLDRYNLLDIITNISDPYILAIGLGLVVLIYLQFKDNKAIGINSFIKSLPYNNKQIYGVKLITGILSYTIPFVIAYLTVLAMAKDSLSWFTHIQEVSPLGISLAQANNLGSVALYGILIYSITLAVYLFLFLMQYIINPAIGSVVISFFTLGAFPYIVTALNGYLSTIWGDKLSSSINWYLSRLQSLLFIPGYFTERTYSHYNFILDGNPAGSISNYTLKNLAMSKIGLFFILSILFFVSIQFLSKNYKVENQEPFVSSKWGEKILIVGVTLCSVATGIFLIADMRIGRAQGTSISFILVLHFLMLLCGGIGYIIIKKICTIGKH